MNAVSKAFAEVEGRAGCVIGIVPTVSADPLRLPVPGYPNPWVEIPIFTHLGVGGVAGRGAGDDQTSRNHINILTSSAVILLPGGEGTVSEAQLALRYGTPAVAFLRSDEEMPSLPSEIPIQRDFEQVAAFIGGCL